MRTIQARAAVLMFILAGCAGDTPTGVRADGLPTSLARTGADPMVSQPRPIDGRCETQFTPLPDPVPLVFSHAVTGVCQLTHLGGTTFFMNEVVNFATGAISSNDVTFTAANGDVLRATAVGMALPSGRGVHFSGGFTFTGGTGRFEHASGTATFDGSADFVTNTGVFTMDGRITYDASNQSGRWRVEGGLGPRSTARDEAKPPTSATPTGGSVAACSINWTREVKSVFASVCFTAAAAVRNPFAPSSHVSIKSFRAETAASFSHAVVVLPVNGDSLV